MITDSQLVSYIQQNTEKFILENKKKYHVYKLVHQHMKDLTEETYQETLKFIKDNTDIFFEDHSSAINFFGFVKNSISSNVFHLELIFDILIYFIDEFKKLGVTENEMFSICIQYINYVNYLFQKKIISLTTIIEQSYTYPVLLINFLPEIREYDPEYAQLRETNFFEGLYGHIAEDLQEFKKIVDSDPKQHIKNREINYHPSILHKSIREDDIDTFQSFLSKNAISINYRIKYSFYERTQPHENSTSLIQTATIYGAKKIIKFLLLQQNLILDDNLIPYSFFSYDLNLIHYYEQHGCPLDNATYMPIYMHQKDILNYYLENHSDQISENNLVVKICCHDLFKNDDDNLYNLLNYDDLQYALNAYNYSVIKKCLTKICFIVRKIEFENSNSSAFNISFYNINPLLISAGYQFDLFKFICSQSETTFYNYIGLNDLMIELMKRNMNDAFKFLFNILKSKENSFALLFKDAIQYNNDMANYLLDLQINEMNENLHQKENSLFKNFGSFISIYYFKLAFRFFNEDIVLKMFLLYNQITKNMELSDIIISMKFCLSNKMISNLFVKIPFFSENNNLQNLLEDLEEDELAKFVKENMKKK